MYSCYGGERGGTERETERQRGRGGKVEKGTMRQYFQFHYYLTSDFALVNIDVSTSDGLRASTSGNIFTASELQIKITVR